jgi:zinc transport system substrate-binding protein
MLKLRRTAAVVAALIVLGIASGAAGQADDDGGPRVVVGIKPVHAIVAAVMAGVAAPALIVEGGTPHAYALRPSQARRVNDADVVFWVGPTLETFLAKPLAALAGRARVVTLIDLAGTTVYPIRRAGVWQPGREPARASAAGDARDPHLWLDPDNAKIIARAAAAALAAADPAHGAAYAANAEAFAAAADALDAELRAALAPLKVIPYAVYHDAFQYFERRYDLAAIGSVTISPERRPGARRLRLIRAAIRARGARCLFREPQIEPALVRTVAEGAGVRVGILDALGADLPPGADLYPALMRNLAQALADCLAAEG